MTLSLGVDTGGTYTDAVLIRDEDHVIAKAKSLTTRQDLALGIGRAVAAVLAEGAVDPGEISLASLSTTLATNALIEGQGERVALVLAGFAEADLAKHGLEAAMAGDPVLCIAGGHDHAGQPLRPLDEPALTAWLAEHGTEVSGFAVAAQFATRNPAHERRIAELIRATTGRPVSASHHLSATGDYRDPERPADRHDQPPDHPRPEPPGRVGRDRAPDGGAWRWGADLG